MAKLVRILGVLVCPTSLHLPVSNAMKIFQVAKPLRTSVAAWQGGRNAATFFEVSPSEASQSKTATATVLTGTATSSPCTHTHHI